MTDHAPSAGTTGDRQLPERAGLREWIGLAVLALPCMVYAMDLTVLNLAVPALSADLQPTGVQLLWIVDVYGFVVAGLLITMGGLGDRIGRRRLLLLGAAGFAVASVLAAVSTSAPMLIAARALLGVAGATLAPSTLSLIRVMFLDAGQRTTAIGVWITSFSAGAAVGPLVGGALLQHFWWGSVFLINLPVMVALLCVGRRLLPEYRDPAGGRVDVLSAVLSLIATLALVYGLKDVAQDGLGPVPVLVMAAGLGLAVVFLRRQRRLADPLIDLRLFQAPAFRSALGVYTAGFFVNFGLMLLVAQYLQLVLGLSALAAGAWMLPSSVAFIVGSLAAAKAAQRAAVNGIVASGLVLAAVGCAVMARVGPETGLALLVVGSTVTALGLAAVFTLATDVAVGSAPPGRAGAAASISETGSEFGGALGIAVLGLVGTAVYRVQVAPALEPGLSAVDAVAARDTLAGAVTASGQLPEAAGAALLQASRAAFTSGLQLSALLSAALLLAAAVTTALQLHRGRTMLQAAG